MLINIRPLKQYRDYRLLYVGQFVSFFGTMLTSVAIPYQLYQLTHSSFLVGVLGAVQLVPLLGFALLGGSYADAMDRRKLLIASELALTLASGSLLINALLPHPQTWMLFAAAAVMSAVNGFHRPALDAMTQSIVPKSEYTAIAALGSIRWTFGAIAGPAAAGVLLNHGGLGLTYALDCATFLISLGALAAIRAMPPPESGAEPGLKSIAEGLRYAKSRPELVGTYVVDIVAMTFAMPAALFPAMAAGWGGASAAGWLYAAMPIGVLAVTLLSGWTERISRHGAAVVWAAGLWGVAITGLAFAQSLAFAVVCLALAGAADSVSAIFRSTIWNHTIPPGLRGRLSGVEMISYMSGPLLGNLRAGSLASMTSNFWSISTGGVICVVGVAWCARLLPEFWSYRGETRTPAPL